MAVEQLYDTLWGRLSLSDWEADQIRSMGFPAVLVGPGNPPPPTFDPIRTVNNKVPSVGGNLTISAADLDAPTTGDLTAAVATRAPATPIPAVGRYLIPLSPHSAATSNTLGNNTLRVIPWLVERTLTVDRIGADIATAGETGSKVRLGIYADSGDCYPGSLVVDAGQINGDSATVQEITISTPVTLAPGLYWIGAAVQSAPITQPTVRTVGTAAPPVPLSSGNTAPTAGQAAVGYSQAGVSGALPSPFTPTLSLVVSAPRLYVRAAATT